MFKKAILSVAIASLTFGAFAVENNQTKQQKTVATSNDLLAVVTDVAELEVKVVSVDKTNHTLTVDGLDGKPATFMVSKKVNIDNVVPGDVLKAAGAKSVVLSVVKVAKDVTPGAAETLEVKVSTKKDNLPFEEVVKTLYLTAKVVAYDKNTQVVTIETPTHAKVTMKVDKKVKELAQGKVKVGDEIMVTYTQGFIVGLTAK